MIGNEANCMRVDDLGVVVITKPVHFGEELYLSPEHSLEASGLPDECVQRVIQAVHDIWVRVYKEIGTLKLCYCQEDHVNPGRDSDSDTEDDHPKGDEVPRLIRMTAWRSAKKQCCRKID
jgi:hypothetical protein